ncbi:UNVERIFIED_CONTAM: hypothetical protein NCL1_63147 [Trichonephila clavipes]
MQQHFLRNWTVKKSFACSHQERHLHAHTKESFMFVKYVIRLSLRDFLKTLLLIHSSEKHHVCEICNSTFCQIV